MTEGRRQRTEGRRQRTEGGSRRWECGKNDYGKQNGERQQVNGIGKSSGSIALWELIGNLPTNIINDTLIDS